MEQASSSNFAGVLHYCVKCNYLGGADKAMGSSVLGKLTCLGQATGDSGFEAGSKGLLETGAGTPSAWAAAAAGRSSPTRSDLVLKHAQSLR